MPASAALGKFEDERGKLIQFMDIYRPQGSLKNEVTIVFDGRPGPARTLPTCGLRVIFSAEESADARILAIVTESVNKKRIIVVTDDRDVRYAVRACGAKVMAVEEFLAKTPKARKAVEIKKASAKETENTKYISKTLESRITAEFEKIWLNKKNQD